MYWYLYLYPHLEVLFGGRKVGLYIEIINKYINDEWQLHKLMFHCVVRSHGKLLCELNGEG